MKNVITKIITTLIFTTALATGIFAQKAEPKEIKFAKGRKSATVQGRLKAEQQAEYVIRGKAGQMVTLTFNSTVGRRAEVFVSSPTTSGEATNGNKSWEVEFGSEGKLNINISCLRACSYTLTTKIK